MNATELKPIAPWITRFANGDRIERRTRLTEQCQWGQWHLVTDHSQIFMAGSEFREAPELLECWALVFPGYETEFFATHGRCNDVGLMRGGLGKPDVRKVKMIEATRARLLAEELIPHIKSLVADCFDSECVTAIKKILNKIDA